MDPSGTDDVLEKDLHVQATYVLTEALIASESRMRQRLELLSEIIFETDRAGRLVFLNRAWGAALGYQPEECLGRPLLDFLVPEDLFLLSQVLTAGSRSLAQLQPRVRFRSRTGSIVWMEVSATSLEGGGSVGALHNVTRQKEAQDEIAKLSLVASFTDSMVIITNGGGVVEWANRAFLDKTGYRMEEVSSLDLSDIFQGPSVDPETAASVALGLREKRAFQCELLNHSKSGEPYWASVYVSPVHGESGAIEHFVCVLADTTKLKQAQSEMETAKEAAEAATERAVEASRLKSEFLANMSHEVRTPMNGILGMTWLVLQGELTDEQREYMETIKYSADTLLVLLNDILDFSKMEAGKLTLDKVQFSPQEMLAGTVRLLEPQASKKGLQLVLDLTDDLPHTLFGDPTRLQQVITNLVGNAIKFTERGWIRVQAEVEAFDETGILLHFSVRDTGIGIPPEKQQQIFEAFTQADGSITRRYGGTGLGLTISSRLVSMYGGKIWIQSQVGKGSTFHFTARLEPSAAGAAAAGLGMSV